MPRNGSGTYSLPAGSAVANGDTSDATDVNTPLNDIESDMNTARPVVAGGTGATSASAARTNLGLAIGTDVQAFDANLQSISALGTQLNQYLYTTASDTWAEAAITPAGRGLLAAGAVTDQRVYLGLGTAATRAAEDTLTNGANLPDGAAIVAYVDAQIAARRYTSTARTITSGGLLTLTHGLASTPGVVLFRLECTSADAGYAIGDEIIIAPNWSDGTRLTTAYVDATNVYVRFSNVAGVFGAANKSTGVGTVLTNSRWDFYVEAMI